LLVNIDRRIVSGMKTELTHPVPSSSALEPRLGVDIGRVIIEGDGPDTSFVGGSEEDALRAPAIHGAFEALARLSERFEGRVWLISKCGKRVEARTRTWLDHHRFFETTGIHRENLLFCRTRPEKAPLCARLGITCFVDDRWDVIASMDGIVRSRVLFGTAMAPTDDVVAAAGWREAEAAILSATNAQIG
jgi:hypothetical protein